MKIVLLTLILIVLGYSQNNYSIYLDGNDCLYSAAFRSSDQSGTISIWVKPISTPNFDVLFSQTTSSSVFFRLRLYGDGVEIDQRNSDTETAINGTTTDLTLNAWNHVVLTSNASTYQLYINGIQQTKNVRGGTDNGDWYADQAINLSNIGSDRAGIATNPPAAINAYIDELSFYDIAKNSEWVQATYNSGVPYDMSSDSDIVSYQRFEEGTGTNTTSVLDDEFIYYFNTGDYAPSWSTDTPGWDAGDTEQDKGFKEYNKFPKFKGLK